MPPADVLIANQIDPSTTDWQEELRLAVRDPQTLWRALDLDPATLPAALAAGADFPLRVPRPYLARIEPGNPADPLLRQVLPVAAELHSAPGFSTDPVGESRSNAQPGLIHKYSGRVLLVVAGGCAVNCRYCFRRHFPYADNRPDRDQWRAVLARIAADPSIHEVILSGGDPLVAPDPHLRWLVDELAAIPHLTRLRVHSRLPVVIPQRVTDDLLEWLASPRWQSVLVLHSNHGRELDAAVAAACQRLRTAGVTLLNQAVLLAGVNDDAATLRALSERLFAIGVLPYYLHLLDRVQGAAHFDVSEDQARRLHGELLASLPGYLVPTLVREDAGAQSKTPLAPISP